jgi:peroxiredoxin Q/BCP
MGILPGRVTYIIDKKGVVRHIFNSQLQPEKHIEEALRILKELEKE